MFGKKKTTFQGILFQYVSIYINIYIYKAIYSRGPIQGNTTGLANKKQTEQCLMNTYVL